MRARCTSRPSPRPGPGGSPGTDGRRIADRCARWAGPPLVPSARVKGESPREACGLFGVWAPGEDVARLTYFGLYALQHRGQESAGIAVSDGQSILVYKELGLVSQVFNEATLATLQGDLGIGHTP